MRSWQVCSVWRPLLLPIRSRVSRRQPNRRAPMHLSLLTGQANGARTPSPCAGRARFCGTVMEPLLSRRLSGSFATEVAVRSLEGRHEHSTSRGRLILGSLCTLPRISTLRDGSAVVKPWLSMIRNLGSIIATGQAWLWLWTFDVQYHQLLVRVSLSRKCLWTTML